MTLIHNVQRYFDYIPGTASRFRSSYQDCSFFVFDMCAYESKLWMHVYRPIRDYEEYVQSQSMG